MTHPRTLIPILLALLILAPSAPAQDTPDPDQIADLMDWGEEPQQRPRRARPANTEVINDRQISFGAFREPIELTTLIDFVGTELDINIVVKGTPEGSVVFNAPVKVPESKLIELLDAMLEQYNYTIVHEPISDFWIVQPISDVRPTLGTERSSTQIISTPNIKPSLILPALSAAIGSGTTPVAATNQRGGSGALQAIDELGVIIVSAPARDITRVRLLVDELLRLDDTQRFIRLELKNIAAPVARERVIGLVGGESSASANPRIANNQGQDARALLGLGGSTLSNLPDRLAVDPQGNALIFRGTDEEIARVERVLSVIDVPNTLEPKSYFAGGSAAQIADMAARRGLGEVIEVSGDSQDLSQQNFRINNQQLLQSNSDSDSTGGPVMVVDTTRGNIVYYGTPAQQEQLAALMDVLGTEDERVVIREVVLNHSDAEVVADLMTALITGETQTGESEFLPGSGGTRQRINQDISAIFRAGGAGSDVSAAFDPDIVSVIADPDNNQVLVKAPIKQQTELAKLIERLDRRKPQVYIEALIISVEDSENFTLAIESQVNAGQFGANSNFGLSSLPTGSTFPDQRTVTPTLGGLTAAVILSDQIPIILNATQTDTDVRILSTPQLLVNDNQESEILSIREEPFTEVSQGDGGNVTGFAGFAEAGTTLRVTPSISDGGFMRLEYFIELSNFTSATGTAGAPPPRNRNTLEGHATIPSDSTIVIGGITVDNIRDTVVKIPLLGDIPLVGLLFRNTNTITTSSKIYVFITPRIMTDPNFVDLRLLTEGPYTEMELDKRVPDLEPAVINAPGAHSRQTLPPAPDPRLEPAWVEFDEFDTTNQDPPSN